LPAVPPPNRGPSAAAPTTQERALARYEAYAGPSIARDAYLLTVASPCDLRFVIYKVGITSTHATVNKGLDSIVVNNALAGGPWECAILEIRPVDVRRMKADLRNPQPPAEPAHR
jgi:hypothetical protein